MLAINVKINNNEITEIIPRKNILSRNKADLLDESSKEIINSFIKQEEDIIMTYNKERWNK